MEKNDILLGTSDGAYFGVSIGYVKDDIYYCADSLFVHQYSNLPMKTRPFNEEIQELGPYSPFLHHATLQSGLIEIEWAKTMTREITGVITAKDSVSLVIECHSPYLPDTSWPGNLSFKFLESGIITGQSPIFNFQGMEAGEGYNFLANPEPKDSGRCHFMISANPRPVLTAVSTSLADLVSAKMLMPVAPKGFMLYTLAKGEKVYLKANVNYYEANPFYLMPNQVEGLEKGGKLNYQGYRLTLEGENCPEIEKATNLVHWSRQYDPVAKDVYTRCSRLSPSNQVSLAIPCALEVSVLSLKQLENCQFNPRLFPFFLWNTYLRNGNHDFLVKQYKIVKEVFTKANPVDSLKQFKGKSSLFQSCMLVLNYEALANIAFMAGDSVNGKQFWQYTGQLKSMVQSSSFSWWKGAYSTPAGEDGDFIDQLLPLAAGVPGSKPGKRVLKKVSWEILQEELSRTFRDANFKSQDHGLVPFKYYLAYQGLKRYHREEEAARLAKMMDGCWQANYSNFLKDGYASGVYLILPSLEEVIAVEYWRNGYNIRFGNFESGCKAVNRVINKSVYEVELLPGGLYLSERGELKLVAKGGKPIISNYQSGLDETSFMVHSKSRLEVHLVDEVQSVHVPAGLHQVKFKNGKFQVGALYF